MKPGVSLWWFLFPSDIISKRFKGKPGSDQNFAFEMCYGFHALQMLKFAKTPEAKKSLKNSYEKTLRMVREATRRNDAKFFQKWARGCEALAEIDPEQSLDPDNFLLAAYSICTYGGQKTSQTEVIKTAIDFSAVARLNGFPNRIQFSDGLTREQVDAVIEKRKLKTIGWKARIKKLGLRFPDKAKRGRPTG
jgi:hypothetical protein